MKRRSFLKRSSIVAPALVGGIPYTSIDSKRLTALINGESDKILVLVHLDGGNDGLAMVVPIDQQDNLAAVRSNVFIPEEKLLSVTDTINFHPSLTGMKSIYDDGGLKVVQGVGYPNQNRSHFRSTDIWTTGSDADQYLTTGWIGRYLDFQFPNYPIDYPNQDCPHPFALSMGRAVSATCQGLYSNFSMAITDPSGLNPLTSPVANEVAAGCVANKLANLKIAIEQTNDYSEVIKQAYEAGNNLSEKYNDEDDLATQLKRVARLISGGLDTKIYVVNITGFDNHAGQVQAEDTSIGIHANLLKSVSDAVYAFQDDLKLMQLDERVLGMTFSEFGRRIRSNDSFGTDHGSAAPIVLFGKCVQGGITGDNPEISLDVEQNEGVPMQYDFRSVYGSILMDWFDLDEADAQSLFPHDFQYIPITGACDPISHIDGTSGEEFKLKVFPNPFRQTFQMEFSSMDDWIKISLFNTLGQELKVISNRKFEAGDHYLTIDLTDHPAGAYFIRLQSRTSQKTVRVNKQ